MLEIINQFYDIEIIGIIKVTDCVYKIKSKDSYYMIKQISICDHDLIETLDTFELLCFVPIIKNKSGTLLTYYNNSYYYMMPYVDFENNHFREHKIKFYFETLSYIHSKTICYKKVNKKHFKSIYTELSKVIKDRQTYYFNLMLKYECNDIKSPFQWFYVLNYYRINNALLEAINYLNQYMELVKDSTHIRVCINYHNFNYQHICLKNKLLISIDHIKFDMPIFDLYDIYQKIPDFMFDLDCFKDEYFKQMNYLEEENILLYCLMNIVPIVIFNYDEVDNIIKLSRLIYYLDSICDFINSSH